MHKREIVFSCHHSRLFSSAPESTGNTVSGLPRVGDFVWCVKCNAGVTVERAPGVWRIKCADCTYGASFGEDRTTALRKAADHGNRKTHGLRVYNGDRLIEWVNRGDHMRNKAAAKNSSETLLQLFDTAV